MNHAAAAANGKSSGRPMRRAAAAVALTTLVLRAIFSHAVEGADVEPAQLIDDLLKQVRPLRHPLTADHESALRILAADLVGQAVKR